MASENYYEILGVSKTATDEEIKSSYKKLARKYHPDLNPGNEEAAEMFKKINDANSILSNAEKRKKYDMENAAASSASAGFGGMGGGANMGGMAGAAAGMRGPGQGPQNGMFSNIFNNVVNSVFTPNAHAADKQNTLNIEADTTVSFVEAMRGTKKKVPVNKIDLCPTCLGSGAQPGTKVMPCMNCQGTGKVQMIQQTPLGRSVVTRVCDKCGGRGKLIFSLCKKCGGKGLIQNNTIMEVPVPKGTADGGVLTFKGEGGVAIVGQQMMKGDLHVHVNVQPHKYLKREKDDLYMDFPIPLSTAISGGKVTVPTVDGGSFEFAIPEDLANGQLLKIKGKGAPAKNGGNGDLYLKIIIDVPKIPKTLKEAFSKLLTGMSDGDYKVVKKFNDDISKEFN